MYVIWKPLNHISKRNESLNKLFKFVSIYLTVFWIGYPTTWILGPSGLEIISQRVDTYLFVILPIFSKVGFGLLSLNGLRKLENI